MSKRFKIISVLIVICLIGAVTVIAGPGSTDDPLVTKSYVDEKIRQIVGSGSGGGSSEIITLQLKAGDILMAGSGSEFILRSGKATAYGDGSNGIPNVTSGSDIAIGRAIPTNSLLIFPRDDGRGIKVTSGPAWVMIRGAYTLKQDLAALPVL